MVCVSAPVEHPDNPRSTYCAKCAVMNPSEKLSRERSEKGLCILCGVNKQIGDGRGGSSFCWYCYKRREEVTKQFQEEAAAEAVKHEGIKKATLYELPESCMFGYLGEVARKLQAPLGFAYPAALTVYAGRWGAMRTRSIRTNLFTALIAAPHEGKGRTSKRAMKVIEAPEHARFYRTIGSSDAGIVEMLGGKKNDKIKHDERFGLPALAFEAEMQDAMNKMDVRGSSLPNKLNTLWEEDEVRHAVKKSDLVAYSQLSILGALTINEPADFTEMWGKNTVSGLYDRFLFGVAPKGWKWDDAWEEHEKVKPELHEPCTVRVDKEIFDMKEAWVSENRITRARLGELALRVAVITTAANGGPKGVVQPVTEECMRCALEFMDWQETIRAHYKPSRADSPGGKLSEIVAEEFQRIKDAEGNYAWASWRDLYRKNNWQRKDGKAIAMQRDALVEAGVLEAEYDDVLDKNGNAVVDGNGNEKRKKTGNYRYAEWVPKPLSSNGDDKVMQSDVKRASGK